MSSTRAQDRERDRLRMPTQAREVVSVLDRPLWQPLLDRAYRAMLERIDTTRGTLSLGRGRK